MNDKEEYIYTYEELLDLVIKYQKENKELSRMCELYSKSLYNADLKKLQSNWNSLREWLENEKLQMEGYFDTVLDKMNELESGDNK